MSQDILSMTVLLPFNHLPLSLANESHQDVTCPKNGGDIFQKSDKLGWVDNQN
jgi:hypothetical protein